MEININNIGKIKYLVVLIIIINTVSAFSQQTAQQLLVSLNKELFPANESTILLHEFINEPETRFKIDSFKIIREHQPDTEIVLSILEEIMHTRDFSSMQGLELIYEKHINLFWDEFSKIYMDNYYPPKAVLDQYTVLAGFETVLKSLEYVKDKYSNRDIFDDYKRSISFYDKLVHNIPDRCKLMKTYRDFSPIYRKLNPCRLFKGLVKFRSIDPFIQEMVPHFINSMQNCKWESNEKVGQNIDCKILYKNSEIYEQINSDQVANYYLNYFQNIEKCGRHSIVIGYANKNSDIKLSKYISHRLVNNFDNYTKSSYPFLGKFVANENDFNLNIVLDDILNLYKTNSLQVNKIIKKLPKERLTKLINDKKAVLNELLLMQ